MMKFQLNDIEDYPKIERSFIIEGKEFTITVVVLDKECFFMYKISACAISLFCSECYNSASYCNFYLQYDYQNDKWKQNKQMAHLDLYRFAIAMITEFNTMIPKFFNSKES